MRARTPSSSTSTTCVVDPAITSADVERRYVELVEEVRAEISVPLAVKLSPWFTALGNLAVRLQDAGADGLVLFNRLYQPDIDLDSLTVVPRLRAQHLGREPPAVALDRQPARHGAVLARRQFRRARRRRCAEAAARRRRRGDDARAHCCGTAPSTCAVIERFIREWMVERDYDSVSELRGSVSRENVPDPQVYERANYYQVLHSWRPERPR